MTDDRDQMRTALAKVVEQAPEPPTVDEIAERIDRGPRVVVGGSGRHGSTSALRWARAGLAAAAVLIAVALGAVLVDGSGDSSDGVTASDPDAPGATVDPVAAVPATPPPGYALIWASDTEAPVPGMRASGTGVRTTMLRYGGDYSLVVTSSVVEPGSDVPETGVSGSVERWGRRDVTVDEDGRRARFVDPGGLLVEVTGEPGDVAAVVPTLALRDATGWKAFLDDVSTDIGDLPVVAEHDLLGGGGTMGIISMFGGGGTTIRDLVVSLHGDGRVADPSGSTDLTPDTSSGVVAGTCLTIGEVTTCRPTAPTSPALAEGATVQASFGVLVDDIWWEFGWSTTELTDVTIVTDREPGGEAVWNWAHVPSAAGGDMSWYATPILEDTSVEVELTTADGGRSGFEQVRPAT